MRLPLSCRDSSWGWDMFEKSTLGSLVERQQGGGTPERNNPRFWNGPIPWASVKDFADDQLVLSSTDDSITQQGLTASTTNLIPAGTPLVCTRMAVGRCAISNSDVSINQDVKALFPKANVSPRYLLRVLDSLKFHAESVSVGSTVKGIRISDLLGIQAPIAPPHEQPKIAQILDTLDTQIQKTEALIAKLEKIKEGLLHDLLTRGIDQNGQLRPKPEQTPKLYKDSVLGLIPKEWEVRQLGSMSEIVSGVTLGGQQPSSSWPLVAYLRVANVQDGYLDLDQIKFLRVKPGDVEKFRLIPGDVLMNEGGDFDKLGRGTVWEGEIELCIHQNHVFRVRTYPKVLDQYFLAYFSGSSMGKSYFVKSSKQSTNLASINSTQLKAFDVPVPPLSEQSAIVEILQSHQRRLEQENTSMNKLQAQKAGLMDDLLTGRVRVTPLLKDAV